MCLCCLFLPETVKYLHSSEELFSISVDLAYKTAPPIWTWNLVEKSLSYKRVNTVH